MHIFKCNPINFEGHMIIKSYKNGDVHTKHLITNSRQDYKLKELAKNIVGKPDYYMASKISGEDADKMYNLLRTITKLDLKNKPNQKALFYDETRIVFGDTQTRLVDGETFHIYF